MPKPAVADKPPDITDFATVEAHCQGEPVYAFGYPYVYGISPDLQPSVQLQQGNSRSWTKIRPKKSWQIKSNKFGSTPAREPRTAANDDQPLLSVHLIDGDPATAWCTRCGAGLDSHRPAGGNGFRTHLLKRDYRQGNCG